jgi:hypothetical protein
MKALIALAAALLFAAPAGAKPYHSYGAQDPCHVAKRQAAANGAFTGGVLGAVVNGAIDGGNNRLGAAVAGGKTGANTGHDIGVHSVKCLAWPARFHPRPHCYWVEDDQAATPTQFELCRDPDGQWRETDRPP